MSDYLRDRFPLADTSTVHMSGESVYNLVRYGKPGIIRSVELFPDQAAAFRGSVREAMAEAHDIGYRQGVRDASGEEYTGPVVSQWRNVEEAQG
ncbi:hypothetical protein SK224_08180 [Microbacterium sp. BG28]|uniref:hypothetical protein n=1 Tax=Microbacterium sp. BG28 TaxID=3097356 RepID=UPI002A59B726|nr:hypothetical protein [Microbacterium sp. BG28]MDY0829105.1 hypothetical protein [Microbacterium sp. BG28]